MMKSLVDVIEVLVGRNGGEVYDLVLIYFSFSTWT